MNAYPKMMASNPNSLEQYLLLAKTAKGAAIVALIKQCVEAPGVYVFSELLEMPNVAEVRLFFQDKKCKIVINRNPLFTF